MESYHSYDGLMDSGVSSPAWDTFDRTCHLLNELLGVAHPRADLSPVSGTVPVPSLPASYENRLRFDTRPEWCRTHQGGFPLDPLVMHRRDHHTPGELQLVDGVGDGYLLVAG